MNTPIIALWGIDTKPLEKTSNETDHRKQGSLALSVTGKKDDYQTCHHPLEDYWNWARHTAMMSEYRGVLRTKACTPYNQLYERGRQEDALER